MSRDDNYRYEQRRLDRLADERRYESIRMDRLEEERRRDREREERLEEEQRREQWRQDDIDAENRQEDREAIKKAQQARNDLAMSMLKGGNIRAAAILWDVDLGGGRIVAPKLSVSHTPFRNRLSWTLVPGAIGYLLQRSRSTNFSDPTGIYRGASTEHIEWQGLTKVGPYFGPNFERAYYRVKATVDDGADSAWSNTV